MNAGPSTSTSYFYSPTIMCDNCCHNIKVRLSQVIGVSNVIAIAFDQEKKNGGCILVEHNNQVQPASIISVLKTMQVKDSNHSAEFINEQLFNELLEENRKRAKFAMK